METILLTMLFGTGFALGRAYVTIHKQRKRLEAYARTWNECFEEGLGAAVRDAQLEADIESQWGVPMRSPTPPHQPMKDLDAHVR